MVAVRSPHRVGEQNELDVRQSDGWASKMARPWASATDGQRLVAFCRFLFRHGQLSCRVCLEPIVWNRKSAPDGTAVGAGGKSRLGPFDRSQSSPKFVGDGILALL